MRRNVWRVGIYHWSFGDWSHVISGAVRHGKQPRMDGIRHLVIDKAYSS